MNTRQENLRIVEQFAVSWSHTPGRQRVREIVSVYKETNRLIDDYPFHLDNHGLFFQTQSKGSGTSEKVYVREKISKEGYPAEVEARVFDRLETWVKENEEGKAIWFSPRLPGKYPCAKIIFHEISYLYPGGEKVVRNSALLFDAGDQETLETIHRLFPQTAEIYDLEGLRELLLFPGQDFDPATLVEAIAEIDPNISNAQQELTREELEVRALQISNLISSGANERQVADEMQKLGLVGRHSISCPPAMRGNKTFAETIGGVGIEDHYGSLKFDCPVCGFKNTRPYGKLIPNCTHCGSNVRC